MAGKPKKVGEEISNNTSNQDKTTENIMTKEGTTSEKLQMEDDLQSKPQPKLDDSSNPNETGTTTEEQPGEEPEEVWDLTEVLQGNHGIVCRMDNCNAKAVAIWTSNAGGDIWPLCEPCQLEDLGGWPVGTEPPSSVGTDTNPVDTKMTDDDDEELSNKNDSQDDAEESEEQWDLKKVYSEKELNDPSPIKCSHDHCKLQAAVMYVSNVSGQKFHSCLDCQVDDYDGWPELDEIPINCMSDAHKELMLSKCSKFKNTEMPVFPGSSPQKTIITPGNTVTPVPNNSNPKSQKQPKGIGTVITPMENTKKNSKKDKPSAQSLQMHAKWREAAVAAGGPDAQIVIKHPVAKKLIYDYLYDSFMPQTINQIYQGLKACVPSPVLKACLDAMALDDASEQFIDSDDEDSESKKQTKKKSTTGTSGENEYQNALCFKAGRGNNGLYYVDYDKAKNGNGLEGDEKNELLSNAAKANAQIDALKHSLNTMTATTAKLLSEPLNEQATLLLQKGEAELEDLAEQLESARKLAVNEKHKQSLKRRIDNMADIWRKRKRMCMEFLVNLEEITDGTVTAKKCFKGDGPKGMELESDEAISSVAVEYHQNKKSKTPGGKKRLMTSKPAQSKKEGIQPTESFVAVLLSSQGRVERVYADDSAN